MKVFVIIPAAGLGTRMSAGAKKGPRPSKQFAELGGVPVLVHTLRKFAACNQVSEIWVALRKNEMESFRNLLQREGLKKPVQVVEGGEHRQESVANALQAIAAKDDDIVLVHDAVRPFVEVETIQAVIAEVKKSGAAIAGVPAVDTIKKVERKADSAVITLTIPREQVVMAQTPQGFLYKIGRKAFDEAAADGFIGTDEASLVERSGHEVTVVMGSARNIKITTPADMELAEFYLAKK
ncbi:MAG TPA: 2-C-methyl-D-erythritol 4-phosphate cytidylyltransferase [Terriglobales bacterium]|jgi:2-C-methyl-D-erythritol 4-phosphate cytidylyltransferase|nr:2-C-methyl-D-erythritol 4-phosphate cytidylyltransferase [Terriglobales bacterium]